MEHDHHQAVGRRLSWSIALNLLLTIAQIVGGILSGSLALLSDALHNFSDVVSLIVSQVAFRMTRRTFTHTQTFGYRRAEVMAAAINAGTLLAIAALLVAEAAERLFEPQVVDGVWVMALAGASIVVNGFCVLLLQGDAEHSLNIRSVYIHLFSDLIGSFAILLGGLALYLWEVWWLDSVLTIFVAVYLLLVGWGLMKRCFSVLMQFAPKGMDLNRISVELCQFPGVKNIHHVHCWQLDEDDTHFEAHVDIDTDISLSEATVLMEDMSVVLREGFGLNHVILQLEYGTEDRKVLVPDD